jgi:hypothetical protein
MSVLFLTLACAPHALPRRSPDPQPDPQDPEMEEPAPKEDAGSPPRDARASASPDAAARRDTAGPRSPDAAAEPVTPPEDAGAPASDDAATVADSRPVAPPDAAPPAPVEEAMWSHTGCDQDSLMFPNIDRNNGMFPPGSCPPPEDLPRDCGGNSRIRVMTATASAYETGYVHPPSYAVDQYLMTRWSSPTGTTAWLALDLGSEQTWKRIYLAWELAHAGDYDIQTSNDGRTWMTIKQVRGGNGYQDIVDVEGTSRHIRINGVARGRTGTGGQLYGYSLFDVVVCGERP